MKPAITDVPETMLWTLHNRAGEAARADAILQDPEALRIYRAIDYDYERSFGPSGPSHAVRSQIFDQEVRAFLAKHPNGVIVNLGEGLETQRFRVDAPDSYWLSVDLPDAMDVREQFITPDDRHVHLRRSALDESWLDEVPAGRPTFVTAQGLFMYFEPADVQRLVGAIAARFPGGGLMFDVIPRWLSRRTTSDKGWRLTPHYKAPPMPWGMNADELEATLRAWAPNVSRVERLAFRFPRGFVNRWVFGFMSTAPVLWRYSPSVVLLRFDD